MQISRYVDAKRSTMRSPSYKPNWSHVRKCPAVGWAEVRPTSLIQGDLRRTSRHAVDSFRLRPTHATKSASVTSSIHTGSSRLFFVLVHDRGVRCRSVFVVSSLPSHMTRVCRSPEMQLRRSPPCSPHHVSQFGAAQENAQQRGGRKSAQSQTAP